MAKMQRDKGRRGEQELVKLLKSYGVPAKRISMMETAGEDKGDVEVAGVWTGEVKIGKQIPKFVYSARKTEDTEFLFMRGDRRKWLVCMDLDWFLERFLA